MFFLLDRLSYITIMFQCTSFFQPRPPPPSHPLFFLKLLAPLLETTPSPPFLVCLKQSIYNNTIQFMDLCSSTGVRNYTQDCRKRVIFYPKLRSGASAYTLMSTFTGNTDTVLVHIPDRRHKQSQNNTNKIIFFHLYRLNLPLCIH